MAYGKKGQRKPDYKASDQVGAGHQKMAKGNPFKDHGSASNSGSTQGKMKKGGSGGKKGSIFL